MCITIRQKHCKSSDSINTHLYTNATELIKHSVTSLAVQRLHFSFNLLATDFFFQILTHLYLKCE